MHRRTIVTEIIIKICTSTTALIYNIAMHEVKDAIITKQDVYQDFACSVVS